MRGEHRGMSRAFVKELDDVIAEPAVRRQSRPMTAAGLARLRTKLASTADESERRALEERISAAVAVAPPPDRRVVALGATVTVTGVGRATRTFTIVGEDEIDVEAGRIGASSPLGAALVGARAADVVVWQRPSGPAELRVVEVSYESPKATVSKGRRKA
jgi:transcription elongation GreA/GreB family factor